MRKIKFTDDSILLVLEKNQVFRYISYRLICAGIFTNTLGTKIVFSEYWHNWMLKNWGQVCINYTTSHIFGITFQYGDDYKDKIQKHLESGKLFIPQHSTLINFSVRRDKSE